MKKRAVALSCVVFIALMSFMPTPVSSQSNGLVGTWVDSSAASSVSGYRDAWELVFKEDGSVSGSVASGITGLLTIGGQWELKPEGVVECNLPIKSGGGAMLFGQKYTTSLRLVDGKLTGSVTRSWTSSSTSIMLVKRE